MLLTNKQKVSQKLWNPLPIAVGSQNIRMPKVRLLLRNAKSMIRQSQKHKFKTFQPLETAESRKLVSAVVSLENVLNGVNIERLKESEVTRAEVQDEVNDILSKFN